MAALADGPHHQALTPANISYAPDNWSLTIRSTDLMVGELRSADIANVQFTRGPAYTS